MINTTTDAFIQSHLDSGISNSLLTQDPILYFLSLDTAMARQSDHIPENMSLLGTGRMTQAELEVERRAHFREIIHVTDSYDDTDSLDDFGDNTPTASGNIEDVYGTTKHAYTKIFHPLRVSRGALDSAETPQSVIRNVERLRQPAQDQFITKIIYRLWNDWPTPAQQQRRYWTQMAGILGLCAQGNYFGGVERAAHNVLQAQHIDAATDLPDGAAVDINLCRMINNGFTKADGSGVFPALSRRSPDGMGPNLFITTNDLFQELADQAEAKNSQYSVITDVPNHPVSGYRKQIIERDGCFYTWSEHVPEGQMVFGSFRNLMVELHPDYDFAWSGFTDKARTEEGGGDYLWGDYIAQLRLVTKRPDLWGLVENLVK